MILTRLNHAKKWVRGGNIKGLTSLWGLLIERFELADKPGPVVDSYSSRPAIAHRLKRPTRSQREQRHTGPYLVLLRVEFTLLRTIASRTVRSYRTLSPLPIRRLAVFSLLHLSSVHTAQALPGTPLFEARTFLPVLTYAATVWPTRRGL